MRALLLASALLLGGCTVDLVDVSGEQPSTNECAHDTDCGDGRCRLGACVAQQGDFDTVLLEITPPGDAEGLGGARFLKTVRGMSRRRTDVELNLNKLAVVRGFVEAYDAEALSECLDGAQSTLPVRVTLTPREEILGLPAVSHVVTTKAPRAVGEGHACTDPLEEGEVFHEFALAVPAGRYDIYVQPLAEREPNATGEGCSFVPHLFRSVSIPVGEVCLPLTPAEPRDLSLTIDWPAEAADTQTLDRWIVDVVHPVTGHRLSARHLLDDERAEVVQSGSDETLRYEVPLPFSLVSGEDFTDPGKNLVRLTPPEPTGGPVIQLVLELLQAAGEPSESQAVLPPLEPFPAPVDLQSWVWEQEAFDRGEELPVSATVTLTATSLQGIPSGINSSFSTEVEVGDDGRLDAQVLPGEYRARVIPQPFQGLAATETSLLVRCARKPGDPEQCASRDGGEVLVQAGRVLLVPPAATLTGRVRFPTSVGSGVDAAVIAVPSERRARACDPDRAGDAGCSDAPLDVLDAALGEDAFLPRTANAKLDSAGRFALEDMDCAGCEEDNGALFDLSVRPAEGSRLPWLVKTAIEVDVDHDLGDLELPLPILHQGVLQLAQEQDDPVIVPGALIRAYIFRDQRGQYVEAPGSIPSCVARPDERCIRSVLQIGETRVRRDGKFELALPSRIELPE